MMGLTSALTIGATVRLLGGTGLVFWSSTTIYKRKSSGVVVERKSESKGDKQRVKRNKNRKKTKMKR